MVTSNNPSAYLSKSLFIGGLQCHKSLYLHKYHPELKDEIPESRQALMQSGVHVGIYAQNLFPGGVEIPFDDVSLSDQIEITRGEIEKGTEILYEPAFSFDNIFVKVDILRKTGEGWEIYEVKQSTQIKNFHYDDVAVQYYVLKGVGLPVSRAFLVHINNEYVRQGDIDVSQLFAVQDLTDQTVEKQELVKQEIGKMRQMLGGDPPDIGIGPQCEDPYGCDFQGHCWQHLPENSIFQLRGRGLDKFGLYRQGIVEIKDVPETLLSWDQAIQRQCLLDKKQIVNAEAIRDFLNSLWYPLCFLDFETTYMVPIPIFDGTRPYQHVPFQYSLHCLENADAELVHYEYLGAPRIDPREGLIENLLIEVPEDACILVYNQSFETRVLNSLKDWFPEHAGRIDGMIMGLRDLMIPFRNRDFYHWKMEGSYSLKYALPVLVPELSYDELELSDGEMASNAYLRMSETHDLDEIENLRQALLQYCKLDTLGMVRILEKLIDVCH